MSLSTIIAKVILKIMEAFGIKPPVQDKRKIMQDKQAQDALANALKRNPKLGQMLADSDNRPPETLDPPTVSQDSRGHSELQWYRFVHPNNINNVNRCTSGGCYYSAKIIQYNEADDLYRVKCQRCMKTGKPAESVMKAVLAWNKDNLPGTPLPKADPAGSINEPLKPRTLGTSGSAGPVTVDAQTEGPLINHVPRPLDDAHFGGLSTAGEVATEPAPILPPEATDPTDAPDWIDDKYGAYDPNWKQK